MNPQALHFWTRFKACAQVLPLPLPCFDLQVGRALPPGPVNNKFFYFNSYRLLLNGCLLADAPGLYLPNVILVKVTTANIKLGANSVKVSYFK